MEEGIKVKKIQVTQVQRKEFIREKLQTSDVWAKKALLKIFENQTQDEQRLDDVKFNNSVGFRPANSYILSKLAKFYISKGYMSTKQMDIVFKKIPKYCGQIANISDVEKINTMILNK